MSRPDHIPLIDHLRGIAALMVTWFHLTSGDQGYWVGRTGSYGWLGVEIFFVISGFVITMALARGGGRNGFGNFMLKRLIRLEPPYIASVLMVVVLGQLSAMSPAFRGPLPDVQPAQLLFHLAYLIPFTRYDWLQPVYWSLTYEFFFYIVAGLFLPLLATRRGWIVCVIAAGMAAAAVGVGLAPPRILLFVIGIAACRLYLQQDPLWLSAAIASVSAAVMIATGMPLQACVGLATAALIAGHRHLPPPPARLARLLGGAGTISYSLYLIHVPIGGRIVHIGERFVTTPLQHFALAGLALLICCTAAAGFWWLIERPAHRAAQRYGHRRRSAPVGATASGEP